MKHEWTGQSSVPWQRSESQIQQGGPRGLSAARGFQSCHISQTSPWFHPQSPWKQTVRTHVMQEIYLRKTPALSRLAIVRTIWKKWSREILAGMQMLICRAYNELKHQRPRLQDMSCAFWRSGLCTEARCHSYRNFQPNCNLTGRGSSVINMRDTDFSSWKRMSAMHPVLSKRAQNKPQHCKKCTLCDWQVPQKQELDLPKTNFWGKELD